MALITTKKQLWNLAKDGVRLPSLITGKSRGTHGMVKQLLLANTALYGGYLLVSGPVGLQYRRFFTLDGGSSITSIPLCHFSHTDPLQFAFNSAVLYTVGHWHAKSLGCSHLASVAGLSMAAATVLGVYHVYNNNEQAIAGSMAISSGLITYNVFKNPRWFTLLRIHPFLWLGGLATYSAYSGDKAALGGVAGGYVAFLLL